MMGDKRIDVFDVVFAVVAAGVIAFIVVFSYLNEKTVQIDILDAAIYVEPIAGGFNVTVVITIRNPNPFNITISGISADLGDICGIIFPERCKTPFFLWEEIDVPANTTKVIAVSITRNLAVTVTDITVVTLRIRRSTDEQPLFEHRITVHAKVILISGDRSPA